MRITSAGRPGGRGKMLAVACCFLVTTFPLLVFSAEPTTQEMVGSSVSSTEADWKAISHYSYTEQDSGMKDGVETSKTYEVCMIEGTPYSRLVSVGGVPLSPAERVRENEKLRQEIQKRATESPEARAKRVADYQKSRDRLFKVLDEMARAFDFKQVGQQAIEGRETYIVEATPRAGYRPRNSETRMLPAMRGKLWIDKDTNQWVKVEAVAVKPVTMGWFIAKVLPGTRFFLEQKPVMQALWLPQRFGVEVNAKILCWQKHYVYHETYSSYRDDASHLAAR